MNYELRRLFTTAKHLGLLGLAALALAAGSVAHAADSASNAVAIWMAAGGDKYTFSPSGGTGTAVSGPWSAGTGPTVKRSLTLPSGPVVDVAARVRPGALVRGAASLAGGPLGIGILAGTFLWDYLNSAPNIRLASDHANNDGTPFEEVIPSQCPGPSSCTTYQANYVLVGVVEYGVISTSLQTTCSSMVGRSRSGWTINSATPTGASGCYYSGTGPIGQAWSDTSGANLGSMAPLPPTYAPRTWSQAEFLYGMEPTGQQIESLFSAGGSAELTDPLVVSGPASKQVSQTVKQEPLPGGTAGQTQTTTTTTTNNYTYNNNQVTVNTVTTVTTVNNVTGESKTATETTSKDVPEPDKSDPCKAKPDSLGCMSTDVPTDQVPKTTKNVTFAPESLGFGSGTCPPPISWTDSLGTHSLNLANYCSMLSNIVKPVVLCMALLAAFFIVAPVREGAA